MSAPTPWSFKPRGSGWATRAVLMDSLGNPIGLLDSVEIAHIVVEAVNSLPILQSTATIKEAAPKVRHTCCMYCNQDIEGIHPFKLCEWRDRGNNTTCPSGPKAGFCHVPVKD